MGEIVSLKEQEVEWKNGLRNKAWLVGVIKSSLISVLDAEELIKFATLNN